MARAWALQGPGVVRVVISDADFVYNLRGADQEAFQQTVMRSRHFVLLLLGVEEHKIREAWTVPVPPNLEVVTVASVDAFGTLAAQLADSLFPPERR